MENAQIISVSLPRKGVCTVVIRCPNCGKKHAHGLGTPVSHPGDVFPMLGSRVPHCHRGDAYSLDGVRDYLAERIARANTKHVTALRKTLGRTFLAIESEGRFHIRTGDVRLSVGLTHDGRKIALDVARESVPDRAGLMTATYEQLGGTSTENLGRFAVPAPKVATVARDVLCAEIGSARAVLIWSEALTTVRQSDPSYQPSRAVLGAMAEATEQVTS